MNKDNNDAKSVPGVCGGTGNDAESVLEDNDNGKGDINRPMETP